MRKIFLLSFLFLSITSIKSQQITLEGGKTISSFEYENYQGEPLENLQSSNNTYLSLGLDVDDDIEGYDVYFSSENPPSIHANDIIVIALEVPLSFDTIYYWKIVTKDSEGNSSDSDVYQFKN